ncbi:hypothetical protein H5410_022869 [Solanum commersonii]|uniref:Uncharacterized protein n=1 Tax=Solanum commersonii TaxID=4109 RepID=A0A9J5ZIS9_SOLCO|nr:hypothetical protein H5410_022869 [Solanum commersonii]
MPELDGFADHKRIHWNWVLKMLRHLNVESTRMVIIEEILLLPSTNADVSSSPQKDNDDVFSSPHKNRDDLSSSPQIDRIDVSSSQPFDENENRHLNQNQSPFVEEQSPFVEEQFPRVEKHAPRVEEHSDSDSLYDVDKNIDNLSDLDEELLQARQSNIQEQVKEKADRVNLDEISSDHVGIDSDFEDIYKDKRGRFEGNLGGDDPYFDSSDPGSDISEDEGDPVENDEVVDPLPRNKSTKIYFDPTTKKIQSLIQKQYGLYVSTTSCRKAKLRVMNEHLGDFREEFARLYDYADELKTTNSETTVSIRTSKNTISGKKFLKCIKHDLELTEGEELTMMSDMQKGFHLALIELLPNVEIRWCARHIWKLEVRKEKKILAGLPGHHLRPAIDPPEITAMPRKPGKNRRKYSNELLKKKFEKDMRKGRKMKCLCKNVRTSYARTSTVGTSAVNTGTSPSVALASTLAGRPTNASSSDMRPLPTLTSARRPISATSDVRPATTSTFCGRPTTTPLSTQQSTSSAAGHKRKTSTTLRGGATLGYKRPRQKKRSKDNWLWSLIWISLTNIDLGYKPNGLRWKERVAVTQRQLQEDSYRSTQGTTDTHATPITQGTH